MENDEILNTIIFLAQEAKLAMQDDDFGTGVFGKVHEYTQQLTLE